MLPVTKGIKGNVKQQRAANSFVRENRGGASIRGIATTVVERTINFPNKVNQIYCENVGANEVGFKFNSDTMFWRLAPGEKMPFPIDINPRTDFVVRSFSGPSNLRCILMG